MFKLIDCFIHKCYSPVGSSLAVLRSNFASCINHDLCNFFPNPNIVLLPFNGCAVASVNVCSGKRESRFFFTTNKYWCIYFLNVFLSRLNRYPIKPVFKLRGGEWTNKSVLFDYGIYYFYSLMFVKSFCDRRLILSYFRWYSSNIGF